MTPLQRTSRPAPKCRCVHSKSWHRGGRTDCGFVDCECRAYRPKALAKGKPPQRKRPIKRSTKPIKAKGKRRFPLGADPDYLMFIRTLPCAVDGRMWSNESGSGYHLCGGARVEAAHIKSKGAGGGDVANVLPLCASAHSLQHRVGIASWATQYGFKDIDALKALAADYAARYDREHPVSPQGAPNTPTFSKET